MIMLFLELFKEVALALFTIFIVTMVMLNAIIKVAIILTSKLVISLARYIYISLENKTNKEVHKENEACL